MYEQWKHIPGFDNYMVSDGGAIVNIAFGRELSLYQRKDGHVQVTLYQDGKRYARCVSTLVAEAFMIGYSKDMRVHHIDGDLANNDVRNLEHAILRDRYVRGNWNALKTKVRIKETGEVFPSIRACAEAIGGNYSNIYKVLRGERLKHMGYSFEWYDTKGGY